MKVRIGDKQLFFDVEGLKMPSRESSLAENPTLILLHGAPGFSDHSVFKPAFSRLRDAAQLIYLDLAGAGRSEDEPDGIFSLERWADDLVELCERLGIREPVVLGLSGGGFVAAAYGIRHPDHPGKLILASTQAKLDPERSAAGFERLGGPVARDASRGLLAGRLDAASMAEYLKHCIPLYNRTPQDDARESVIVRPRLAEAFHGAGGIWQTVDLLDGLSRIRCPTLVLAGEDDPITPIEDSEDIVARLDPAIVRFERFPKCGHGVWRDDPERAFATLREFIAD